MDSSSDEIEWVKRDEVADMGKGSDRLTLPFPTGFQTGRGNGAGENVFSVFWVSFSWHGVFLLS